jgi:hypothetical protein
VSGPDRTGRDRRPLLAGLVVLVTAGLALGVLLTRTGPVDVAIPDGGDDPACLDAGTRWPLEVAGEDERDTDPAGTAVHAWGDPAVIARCGLPALGPTTEQCISVDGVDWVARELSDGTALTTFGRSPAIEVLVPDEVGQAPLVLPAFADAAKALPTNGRQCD